MKTKLTALLVFASAGTLILVAGNIKKMDTRTDINEPAGAEWASVDDKSKCNLQAHCEKTRFSRDRSPRQGLGAEDLTGNAHRMHDHGYAANDVYFTEASGAERSLDKSRKHDRQLREDRASFDAVPYGKMSRASDLIGMEVKNAQNERIGEIKDVVLDLHSGRVAYTVLNPRGWGLDEKLYAVPPSMFTRSSDDKSLVFNTDKETLMTAPSFEKNSWPQADNQQFSSEVYRFYHQRPYWQTSDDIREPSGSQLNRRDDED